MHISIKFCLDFFITSRSIHVVLINWILVYFRFVSHFSIFRFVAFRFAFQYISFRCVSFWILVYFVSSRFVLDFNIFRFVALRFSFQYISLRFVIFRFVSFVAFRFRFVVQYNPYNNDNYSYLKLCLNVFNQYDHHSILL